jgi:predicted ferric reductase
MLQPKRWKTVLLILLAMSVVIPPLFVRLDEPTIQLQIFKVLAKIGSLSGVIFMLWQVLLGFRGAVSRVMPDLLWSLDLHKKIGTYLLLLIILHPIFISFYYLEKFDRNLFLLKLPAFFDIFVLLGIIAFAILLLIIVSSLYRQHFKSYTVWYLIHLTSYLLLPLVFVHSLPIGQTVRATGLRFIWWGLAGALVILIIYRLAVSLGLSLRKHRVTEVARVGPQVTRITMQPLVKQVEPAPGQFIFLRWDLWSGSRPFTVSHYDNRSGALSVTVKALGKMTARLQGIRPGEILAIDGPYGVFTPSILEHDRPVVMIAGGIGITPFIRLMDELAGDPGRELYLFYGNKYSREIVYKEEIEAKPVKVIHVLSDEAGFPGEKGFITSDLLKKYLARNLKEYDYLICGPPIMTTKLKESLAEENVPAGQIHYELFSY